MAWIEAGCNPERPAVVQDLASTFQAHGVVARREGTLHVSSILHPTAKRFLDSASISNHERRSVLRTSEQWTDSSSISASFASSSEQIPFLSGTIG